DFTGVSKGVMNSVVHIRSTHKVQATSNSFYNNQRNPFGDMFGDDFFRFFQGTPDPRGKQQGQSEPFVQMGSGSGVIISSDGYIVTNNHVIDKADEIEVTLHNNETYKAKVIGTDPSTDIALLQIREDKLQGLSFGNSDLSEVGEWVMAIGNPFNLRSTVTAGIISAKGRNINIIDDQSAIEAFIQTDAAINPGNSGGALVNLKGELIGINTAIASPTGAYAGYGFAIPANIVDKVVGDLLKYGMVQRAYLGIMIRNIDGNLIKDEKLERSEGTYVDSLMENSAAAEAGILAGDVITGINDTPVLSSSDLLEQVGRRRPGDEVEVTVDRSGKEMTFQVKLADQKGERTLLAKKQMDIIDVLGVKLEELDRDTAGKLGIEGGVRVTEMGNGLLKNQTSISEGFIITGINHDRVTSVNDLRKYLKQEKGGVLIQGIYENYPGELYFAFGLPE
ncbi:MAG: Do family serine endopeptidase, partial [Bacteroidales bacterium]|nr:Do family serine endopeptidase [Bacteroidales bacterium]